MVKIDPLRVTHFEGLQFLEATVEILFWIKELFKLRFIDFIEKTSKIGGA